VLNIQGTFVRTLPGITGTERLKADLLLCASESQKDTPTLLPVSSLRDHQLVLEVIV